MVGSTNSTPRNHQDQMPQANFAATPAFVHALPGVPYHPPRDPERTLDYLLPLALELESPTADTINARVRARTVL